MTVQRIATDQQFDILRDMSSSSNEVGWGWVGVGGGGGVKIIF